MSEAVCKARDGEHPLRRIVLTGFMGSGKSTVGPIIAQRLQWRFADADDLITSRIGIPISQYFSRFGEPNFRKIEADTIADVLKDDGLVLALGGGAIETASTRSLLTLPGTVLVHLDVTLETTLARCCGTEADRPVLADRANLAERFARRLPLYRQAHLSVPADLLSPGEIADAIIKTVLGAVPRAQVAP